MPEKQAIKMFDVVALTENLPEDGLIRGQVGTVVEEFGDGAFEVEFSNDEGRAYAQAAISADQLMVLHHRPAA